MDNKPVPSSRWRLLVIRHWHPQPLTPPKVHRKLPQLPALQRGAVVIRYSLLRLEYWVSPGGGLRQWLRFNVGLALLIGIPAIVLAPIITVLLALFVSWTGDLVQIAMHILTFVGLVLAIVALMTAALLVLRKFSK